MYRDIAREIAATESEPSRSREKLNFKSAMRGAIERGNSVFASRAHRKRRKL